jgi:hypothetical protein
MTNSTAIEGIAACLAIVGVVALRLGFDRPLLRDVKATLGR